MGYLSQKKSQFRQNAFLTSAAVVFALLTLAALFINNFGTPFFNLLHIFLLSFIFVIFALICQKFKMFLLFLILFLINYIHLSSTANIFFLPSVKNGQLIDMVYNKDIDLRSSLKQHIKKSGIIVLSENHVAQYIKTDSELTVISLNWNNITKKEFKTALNNLHGFIVLQDSKVVVLGDFGRPIWEGKFAKFMENSGLRMKNNLLFTNNAKFSLLNYPTFYILGFDNVGVDNIKENKENDLAVQISFIPLNI